MLLLKPSVLIIDNDRGLIRDIKSALCKDWNVIESYDKDGAYEAIREKPAIVLLDIRLDDHDETNRDGMDILKHIKEGERDIPVVMMTAFGQIDIAVEAMKLGADEFIQKGSLNIFEYEKILNAVLEKRQLKKRLVNLQRELDRIEPWRLIGETSAITEIKRLIEMAAGDGVVSVLITGDTGTGKELVARAIHERGRRSEFPFLPVCISSLNPNTIESELFGHEKGSFTGAAKRHIGYFESAEGGVLLLDEIGELSGEMQVKLLRFIEDRKIYRMGGNVPIEIDVQLITATNADLEATTKSGRFRKDLYYRLKTFQIVIPPLTERRADVPILADYFIEKLRLQGRTRVKGCQSEVLSLLSEYEWPGNVRELRACIERAAIFSDHAGHEKLEIDDLPMEIRKTPRMEDPRSSILSPLELSMAEELARMELMLVRKALIRTKGRKLEAQRLLGYKNRFTMLRRIHAAMERYPRYKSELPEIHEAYGLEKADEDHTNIRASTHR